MTAGKMGIIGVDSAVDPRKTGLAYAAWDGRQLSAVELLAPRDGGALDRWITERIRKPERLLFAIDSPLGWPASLGVSLSGHRAGRPVGASSDGLFRRLTDQVVRERTGKQPLEVGADRIARTAVAALDLLDRAARRAGEIIELAWEPEPLPRVSAIETYPAAWLLGRGLPARRYKDSSREAGERRVEIVRSIEDEDDETRVVLDEANRAAAVGSSHLLDALICLLCGVDFLLGRCRAPGVEERELAAKEGWIWFRDWSSPQ